MGQSQLQFETAPTEKTFTQKLGDYYDKGKEVLFGGPQQDPIKLASDPNFAPNITDQTLRYQMAKDATQKTLLQKYGPTLAVLGGGAYLTGAFDEPEPEPSPLGLKSGPSGTELLAQRPDLYAPNILPGQGSSTYIQQNPYPSYANLYPTNYGLRSSTPADVFQRQPMYAAEGGEVYPRRNGGIMPNEGIPGQDSVRAMLMPGEFVMTTDAVRGAGGGDLNRGINNMYNVMANLERKGRMA